MSTDAELIDRLATDPEVLDEADQIAIPVKYYRGGTSKAYFVERRELAHYTKAELQRWLSAAYGSPDYKQIDGVGGSDQATSKFALLGPPTHPDADIDYSFFQVSIDSPEVHTNLNCGNISSAVALYAVDEGYVTGTNGTVEVRIHNTNHGNILYASLQLRNGKAVRAGSYFCGGVPGTAAPIEIDFRGAGGCQTGKLLPTGNAVDLFEVPGIGNVEVSIVDIANMLMFVPASAFGVSGNESIIALQGNKKLVESLEWLRGAAAQRLGLATSPEEATEQSPVVPLVSLVSQPQDWAELGNGNPHKAEDCDLVARGFVMRVFSKAYFGTGSVCTGVAASIPGTVVNRLTRPKAVEQGRYRVAHPSGIVEIEAKVISDGPGQPIVKKAAIVRTARKLLEGTVFVAPERMNVED